MVIENVCMCVWYEKERKHKITAGWESVLITKCSHHSSHIIAPCSSCDLFLSKFNFLFSSQSSEGTRKDLAAGHVRDSAAHRFNAAYCNIQDKKTCTGCCRIEAELKTNMMAILLLCIDRWIILHWVIVASLVHVAVFNLNIRCIFGRC